MKLTISRSKNAVSFYVQKSVRLNSGATTTVTVEKLGNLAQVTAKAAGKDPYVWAQEYVDELNRKEYEKNESVIISYSQTKIIPKCQQKTFNCGYLFLQSIYYRLKLDNICKKISSRHSFSYDLNNILSRLIYTRILFPSSKRATDAQSAIFIEQPTFKLHDIYRALSVLAEESDFIQSEVYKNSQKLLARRKDILYYDCTNYYFEVEQEDDLRRYGKSKQHQPLPLVGMGLFMDYDGIPLAFDIFPGSSNEQPTLKPLEKKILNDYDLAEVIICTDAGLSSAANRRFNDRYAHDGTQIRSFITTQSLKQLPDYLKEFALDPEGWSLAGGNGKYSLNDLDETADIDKIFYKERWIVEDISQSKRQKGEKPLEQRLIVSFSLKYLLYQRKIRAGQIERAQKLIDSGRYKQRPKTQNDPNRFIHRTAVTGDGEVCADEILRLNLEAIAEEEKYDGFYGICTNLEHASVAEIIHINKKRWQIEECFRIMKTEFRARPIYLQRTDRIKAHFITCYLSLVIYRILEKFLEQKYTCKEILSTLKNMMLFTRDENRKEGYQPAYTRTDLTDNLHETFGFRTDYEITRNMKMKEVIRTTKRKK